MDANVIAAMARWPDVPNAYGWLSLTENGQWRLHPRGDAWQIETNTAANTRHLDASTLIPGESITSPQILEFINRNYACDEHGQWFFQNGPQKVYVRLDAAPYILQTMGNGTTLALRTHNGLDVKKVTAWWLDESGKLYAQTEHGPGLIAGRDLASVLDAIHTPNGTGILDAIDGTNAALSIEVLALDADAAVPDCASSAPTRPNGPGNPTIIFKTCATSTIEQALGFVRYPRPAAS